MARKGLSSASFLGGAMQGYDFVDEELDENRQEKRQEALNERQDQQWDMQKEEHGVRMEAAKDEDRMRGLRFDQFEQEQVDRANRTLAITLAHGGADALTGEDAEFASLHPNFNAARLLSPEFGKALDTAEGVFEGEVDPTSPGVMDALTELAPEIQLGSGGGRKVKPVSIVPGKKEGTFMVNLAVDGDDRPRPLTENRSARDDDPVKQIPLDAFMQRVMIARQAREGLKNPKVQEALIAQYYPEFKGKEKAGELVQHPELGWVQQKPDGTYQQYDPAKGGKSGSGSGSGTARMKDYHFAKNELGFNEEEAREWANSNRSPSERAEEYANQMVKYEQEASTGVEKYDAEAAWKRHRESYLKNYAAYGADGKKENVKTPKVVGDVLRNLTQPRQGGQQASSQGAPASVARPERPRREAPPEAIEELMQNPTEQMKQDFQEYFGYLPEGV